jgi:hypothetical protein
MTACAFNVTVLPFSTTMVALPPSHQTGVVKFDRCFLSLATDFGPAHVRLAIGTPGNFTVEDGTPAGTGLAVPTGRKVVRELKATDEVASIIHRNGPPVTVLIECQGL